MWGIAKSSGILRDKGSPVPVGDLIIPGTAVRIRAGPLHIPVPRQLANLQHRGAITTQGVILTWIMANRVAAANDKIHNLLLANKRACRSNGARGENEHAQEE